MNTSGYIMQGLPNPDGHIFIPVLPSHVTVGAGVTRAKLAAGLIATVQPVGIAAIYNIPIGEIIFRYGMQDDSQMAFGRPTGTSGANALALLPGVVDQTPYSRTSRPPIASANVFGTAGNGTAIAIPKGVAIRSLYVAYQNLTVALSNAGIGITKTIFASDAVTAPAVTNVLLQTNNGLFTQAYPAPAAVNVVIPAASQIMQTSRLAEYMIELQITTAATGTCNIFGIFLDVAYNYN